MDNKSSSKPRILLLEFIELYKSMPCLWDRQHRGYGIRRHRLEAYKTLVHKYREIDPEATLPTVKSRLDIIRCGFIRELKKVRLSKEMTPDPSLQYKPRLWYYNSCTFLEDQYLPFKDMKPTDTSESQYEYYEVVQLKDEEDSQAETEYLEEEISSNSSDHDNKLSRNSLANQSQTSKHCSKNSIEDLECLGKAIALQMRDLNPLQAAIANKLISDTIFYATLGKLTLESHVVVGCKEENDTDDNS